MKRILYLFGFLSIFLASCEKNPTAGFFVNTTDPEIGQEVIFTNDSYNAESFEWDFGDGTYSEEVNPIHKYSVTGSFEVKLTAISSFGFTDEAFQAINVKVPTLLEIEVLEYYDLYPVHGASVILYPTLDDWDAETNQISEGYTNENGIVLFSNLGNFIYYVDVWEEEHNNWDLRDEDPNFVRTPQVKSNQVTKFTAYVDYIGGAKGSAGRDRSSHMVIKKIVPRVYKEPIEK